MPVLLIPRFPLSAHDPLHACPCKEVALLARGRVALEAQDSAPRSGQ